MCGICGFIHSRNLSVDVLKSMNDTISYRGPNDEGYYMDTIAGGQQIGFAQRRLSILDLSSCGHQPMISRDGKLVVTYNGEIYNYQSIRDELMKKGYVFESKTDTEVILYSYQEWGIKCVNKFNGMFAFALYDKRHSTCYLVRDRMGVKPLYYYYKKMDHTLVFASELKPIMKYPAFEKRLNLEALKIYCAAKYIAGEKCIFEDTFKLLPGQYLKWGIDGLEQHQYWSIEKVIKEHPKFSGSYEEAKTELNHLLLDAVQLRMVSDVPIGAFLSNGVDSSLMVSMMQKVTCEEKIKTFTIGFHDPEFDEARYAKKVAEYLKTDHRESYLFLDVGKKMIEDIPKYFDEPMADPSQIAAMLVSKMAKEKVTVAISGDAGDELFCGYNHYEHFSYLKKYQKLSNLLNTINKHISIKSLMGKFGGRSIAKLFYLSNDMDIINSNILTFWLKYPNLLQGGADAHRFFDAGSLSDLAEEKAMFRDMMTYLPDDILVKVDRASMSASLETRAPLLDYRVVEFALTLPLEYKNYNGEKKRILKDILYSYVPKELIGQSKKGFGIPYAKWLKEDFEGITREYFSKKYIEEQSLFDYTTIQKMIKGFNQGKNPNYASDIWTLLMFQIWYGCYFK